MTTDVCARAYPADHTLPVGASVSGLELLRQTLEVINAEAVVAGEDVAGQVTLEAVPVVAFRLPLLQPRHSREQVWVTPPSSPPTTAGEETRAGPPTGAPTNAGPADNTSDPSANLLKPVLHLQPADKNLTARTTVAPPEPEHSHAESNPVEELNQTCCKPRAPAARNSRSEAKVLKCARTRDLCAHAENMSDSGTRGCSTRTLTTSLGAQGPHH